MEQKETPGGMILSELSSPKTDNSYPQMGSKKANLVHKNAGESVLMNIQTNLNNMHAET